MSKVSWQSLICLALAAIAPVVIASEGDSVVVVFNSRMAESKSLAEYDAKVRRVPTSQVFGFALDTNETITRKEFRESLERPLMRRLERGKLVTFGPTAKAPAGNSVADAFPVPTDSKVRYAVLCYGVPLRILPDSKLDEEMPDGLRAELRRNEAAVDSELALLPLLDAKLPHFGPLRNRTYGVTNAAVIHPTNGVLMVARLDGPSAEAARGLVDRAIQAETDGLWGRAYFDARGLTNGSTKVGDDWIKGAAEVTRQHGFETILDDKDERFPAAFPMSHIAFYAGWYEYDGQVSGPFTRPRVEFMPGAFAYHLHSFSAQTIRSPTQNWVGPFLAKGVTATMGCVFEPYLEFTPNIAAFLHRLTYLSFSFGEAAYASQPYLSWQTTVVGDPLYRPYARPPLVQHEHLIQKKSKLIEWSYLKVVNINLSGDLREADLIRYLENTPELRESSVLLEKLADLYFSKMDFANASEAYKKAAELSLSQQQKIRLTLAAGRGHEFAGKPEEAYRTYQQFVQTFSDYPDIAGIYRKLVLLAEQLKKPSEKEQYQRELERLTTSAPARS